MLKRFQNIVWFAALICIVLSFSFAVWQSYAPHNKPHDYQSAQAAEQKSGDLVAIAEKADERLARYTLWLMIFTGVLAVSTIGLWAATYFTLRHNRQTAERQLRAYVSGDGGSLQLLKTDKGRLFIQGHYCFKNFGQTPAHNYKMWVALDILAATTTDFPRSSGTTNSILGPGATAESSPIKGPVTKQELAEVKSGRAAIFIWGEITYVDVFGNERYFKFFDMNGRERPSGGWPISTTEKPYEAN